MAIKSVTKFQSTDGKLHDTIEIARKYDAQQQVISQLRTFFNNQNFGTIHIDIANNPEIASTLKILAEGALNYHRKYGKLKKEPVARVEPVYATSLPKVVVPVSTPAPALVTQKISPEQNKILSKTVITESQSATVTNIHFYKGKIVKQYNEQAELLATYDSVSNASKAVNVAASSIAACCRGVARSAAGYFWAYGDAAPIIRESQQPPALRKHTLNLKR